MDTLSIRPWVVCRSDVYFNEFGANEGVEEAGSMHDDNASSGDLPLRRVCNLSEQLRSLPRLFSPAYTIPAVMTRDLPWVKFILTRRRDT